MLFRAIFSCSMWTRPKGRRNILVENAMAEYSRISVYGKMLSGVTAFVFCCACLAGCTNRTESAKGVTIEDRHQIENTIKSFSDALERKDYTAAAGYCDKETSRNIVDLTRNKSEITDGFGMIVQNQLPVKLISIDGYSMNQGKTPSTTEKIPADTPTSHFKVKYEYLDNNTPTILYIYMHGEYVDGKWLIGGFASSTD